jgi:hypothetical protein
MLVRVRHAPTAALMLRPVSPGPAAESNHDPFQRAYLRSIDYNLPGCRPPPARKNKPSSTTKSSKKQAKEESNHQKPNGLFRLAHLCLSDHLSVDALSELFY